MINPIKALLVAIALSSASYSDAFAQTKPVPRPSTQAADGFAFNEREEQFKSDFDGSTQSYLISDLRTEAAKEKQPIIVIFLHGHGSKAKAAFSLSSNFGTFDRMGRWLKAHDGIYICPEYRGNSWMGPAAEADVKQIIEAAKEKYRPAATILTGGSMGGTSALIFASRNSELLDGVLAWCPATDPIPMRKRFGNDITKAYGGTPEQKPDVYKERTSRDFATSLAKIPVVIVHGSSDAVIPVEHSRVMFERLKEAKGAVTYVEVKNGGHDAPFMADVAKLMNWLLENKKK